jgi:hypothetical protein
MNRDICCDDRKVPKHSLRCGIPLAGDIYSRSHRLHAAREDYMGPSVHEFWNTTSVAPKGLSKLRADAVSWRAFQPFDLDYSEGIRYIREMISSHTTEAYCGNLTSVHIAITTINDDQYDYFFHTYEVQLFFSRSFGGFCIVSTNSSRCISFSKHWLICNLSSSLTILL